MNRACVSKTSSQFETFCERIWTSTHIWTCTLCKFSLLLKKWICISTALVGLRDSGSEGMLEFGSWNTSKQQNGLCSELCWLNQRWSGVIGRSGLGINGPVSFSLFILFSSLFIEGGRKFSFCRFAEKKNRGTGRKLAISWKSKLPSAAATGASYFQKMALALPSSIMHSGIQNRNKEMALDSKYTIRRL